MDPSAIPPPFVPLPPQTPAPEAAPPKKKSKTLIIVIVVVIVIGLLILYFVNKPSSSTSPSDQNGSGSAGDGTAAPQIGQLQATGLTDRCMDVENGYGVIGGDSKNYSAVNGVKVTTWSCNIGLPAMDNMNEIFAFNPNGTVEWYPKFEPSGYCWTQSNDSGGSFTELTPCGDSPNQKYNIQTLPTIKNSDGTQCLDVRSNSNANGVQVGMRDCGAADKRQEFAFLTASATTA